MNKRIKNAVKYIAAGACCLAFFAGYWWAVVPAIALCDSAE